MQNSTKRIAVVGYPKARRQTSEQTLLFFSRGVQVRYQSTYPVAFCYVFFWLKLSVDVRFDAF